MISRRWFLAAAPAVALPAISSSTVAAGAPIVEMTAADLAYPVSLRRGAVVDMYAFREQMAAGLRDLFDGVYDLQWMHDNIARNVLVDPSLLNVKS